MGLFRKKGQEVLDLTKLQESGVLQRSRRIAEAEEQPVHESQTLDLTASNQKTSDDSSSFGFLANLAGAESSSSSSTSSSSSNAQHTDTQGLYYKLEDIEYKLEKLRERLDKLEESAGK